MSYIRSILAFFLAVFSLASCEAVRDIIHDDEVVAKVGKHKFYKAQLDVLIPAGMMPEDSVKLAAQHIQAWAMEQLFADLADTHLSKEEKDVSEELEAYRKSLLRYRYEQRYVNEHIDTLITPSEVQAYYEAHQDNFVLDVPILKVRYVDMMQNSPNRELIRKNMASDNYSDLALVDSLTYSSAIRYLDYSSRWVDAVTLAREFDVDYATMLAMRKNNYIEMEQERGDVKLAYIIDSRAKGGIAPLDYCEARIRNIILSNRKNAILSTLEQDLLEDALAKNKLETIK